MTPKWKARAVAFLFCIIRMATNYTCDYLHSRDDTYFSALFEEEGIGEADEFPDDAMYSEALQFQEALMGSVLISRAKPSSEQYDKKAKAAAYAGGYADLGVGDSSMSFCGICMERKEKMQMFEGTGCAHSYCSDCVTKHVVAKVDGNVARIGCPGLGCKVVLELETCSKILPEKVVKDWSELLCYELIDESQRFYCPYKDCSAMMIADMEANNIVEADCPFCHRLLCARCSVPWHDGLECDEYQQLGEDEKGREDVMVLRLAEVNKWSRCPKCKFYVERTQGCPHMVCRCKFEFCYGCGSKWSQSHSGCARN